MTDATNTPTIDESILFPLETKYSLTKSGLIKLIADGIGCRNEQIKLRFNMCHGEKINARVNLDLKVIDITVVHAHSTNLRQNSTNRG